MRKQLESDGRMHELALHLHQLMSQVADGGAELEAQRREIEAAEGDLKARTALAGPGAPETAAAQQRLLEEWSRFGKTMVDTKSAFITLVTELEALGQGSAGALRPFEEPLQRAPARAAPGPRARSSSTTGPSAWPTRPSRTRRTRCWRARAARCPATRARASAPRRPLPAGAQEWRRGARQRL